MTIFAIGLIVGSLFGGCVVGFLDVRVSQRRLNAIKETCRAHRAEQQRKLNELMSCCEEMQKRVNRVVGL